MKLTTKHIFYFSALISIFFLGTTSYKVFSDVTKIDPVLESKKELTLEDGDIATMSMTPIEWGIGGGYTDYGSAFTVGAATPFNNNPSSGFMNFSVNLATLNNLGGFGGSFGDEGPQDDVYDCKMRVANNLESCMNAANDVALYQSIATGIFAVAAGIFSGGVGAAFIGTVGAAETAHTFNENVNRCTRDNTQGNLECERR